MKNPMLKLLTAVALTIAAAACDGYYDPDAVVPPDGTKVQALNDAQAAAVLSKVNLGEIAVASAVLPRLERLEVRRFAEAMIAEHSAIDAEAKTMLQQAGITPLESPASATLDAEATRIRDELENLQSSELDAAYARTQVDMHREALLLVDCAALPNVQNPALRAFITDRVRPGVMGHYQQALGLATRLTGEQPAGGVARLGAPLGRLDAAAGGAVVDDPSLTGTAEPSCTNACSGFGGGFLEAMRAAVCR